MAQTAQVARVGRSVSLDDLPDVLTVEEAAKVLRISRGAAYELARCPSLPRSGLSRRWLGRPTRNCRSV